jgi:hypothetical protein
MLLLTLRCADRGHVLSADQRRAWNLTARRRRLRVGDSSIVRDRILVAGLGAVFIVLTAAFALATP